MVHCIVERLVTYGGCSKKASSAALAEFDMEPIGNGYRKNIENLRDLLFRGLPIFRVPFFNGHCDGSPPPLDWG